MEPHDSARRYIELQIPLTRYQALYSFYHQTILTAPREHKYITRNLAEEELDYYEEVLKDPNTKLIDLIGEAVDIEGLEWDPEGCKYIILLGS